MDSWKKGVVGEGSSMDLAGADLTLSLSNERAGPSISNRGLGVNLFTQLWLECAGPFAKIPNIGERVFYFPQGHIEQVEAYMGKDHSVEMPPYNIPSRILCKVVHIHLEAELGTDEVIAQIRLRPEHQEPAPDGSNDVLSINQIRRAAYFSKRLSPSDTSTHGGFSIPKRHAEDCFPPLDMSQEVPQQDIVARDLHGKLWRFHHIYRGTPKRHLLSTGWSTFVAAKKLAPGDFCTFVRGETGEIFVGLRRSRKPEIIHSTAIMSSINMQHGILASAFHALSTGTMFTVYYHPWTNPCEFLVGYNDFMKSAEIDFVVGTRFMMKVPCEDIPGMCPNFLGTVVGVGDIDSIRWPNSDWRCLKVQWNASTDRRGLPERVSPWSIEPSGILNLTKKTRSSSLLIGQKRSRSSSSSIHDFPFLVVKDGLLKSSGEKARESEEAGTSGDSRGKYILFGINLLNKNSGLAISDHPTTPRCTDVPETSSCTSSRSCTKVLKYGIPMGRSIDLTRFHGYHELISELDHMFDFEGSLMNESSGWLIEYTNSAGDKKLLGDCHWPEFRATVKKMFISPKEGMNEVD